MNFILLLHPNKLFNYHFKKMKSKILLSAILTLFVSLVVFSAKVQPELAKTVGKNFFYEHSCQFNQSIDFQSIVVENLTNYKDAFYILNFTNGWVIVAGRDERQPVIGYSFEGSFPAVIEDSNVRSWLQNFVDEAKFIEQNQVAVEPAIKNTWNYYQQEDAAAYQTNKNRDVATPLLTNIWNQDSPYNLLCPEDPAGPGGRVYVGCVATAMSMIMHYWRYPLQGSGQHSYNAYPYGTQTVNYGDATYNWDNMLDEIDSDNPFDIAQIGYHAAVSVDMMFGADGSGAYSNEVPYAMRTYFNYDNSVQYLQKNNYPLATWQTLIQDQLNSARPVYYSGQSTEGGHAFVCDGYQGSDYYHFNFGWSGSTNGWYSLSDVNGFSSGQGCVRNIFPEDADYPYIATGQTVLSTVSGSFTDGSGPVENYPSGMDVSWLISPQNEHDSISSIRLKFIQFNTNASDVLTVYAGPTTDDEILGQFSGDQLPSDILSQTNALLVTFSSTGSAPGFQLEFDATMPNWCNGTTAFTEPFGELADGSGTFQYNNRTTCIYVFQVQGANTYTFSFNKLATEPGNDVLKFFKAGNQLVQTISGTDIPESFTVEASMVYFTWTTNSTVRDDGWEISYTTDLVGTHELEGNTLLRVFPNPADHEIRISSNKFLQGENKIVLFNNAGQQIKQWFAGDLYPAAETVLPIADVPAGIYMMVYQLDGKMIREKIIIR